MASAYAGAAGRRGVCGWHAGRAASYQLALWRSARAPRSPRSKPLQIFDLMLGHDLKNVRYRNFSVQGSVQIERSVAGYPVQESEMAYIVLVEDDKDVAEVLCEALRADGHRCFVIRTKAGADRFFRRVRPDLVVMDCLLIGGDGLRLARQLAAQTDVPVIVTSSDSARAEEAEQAGLPCFQKPFRLSELAAAISRLLTKKGSAAGSNMLARHSGRAADRADRDARASRG